MNDENASRIVRYTDSNKLTNNVISVSICDEEIRYGFPSVTLSINNSYTIELFLQDIPTFMSILESILKEVNVFTNFDIYESNREVLEKINTEKWIQMFEHYHDFMKNNCK